MKRVGNLWTTFISPDTAIEAIYAGTVNKRHDRAVVRRFGYSDNLPEHYGKLDPVKVERDAADRIVRLTSGAWKPSPPRQLTKYTPSAGKTRQINCPTLDDHLVHWQLVNTLRPVIERGMYEHSCGSIPGRGIEYARRHIEKWVRQDRSFKYFVKLDIKKFYQSIDHAILKDHCRRYIKDSRILNIIDLVIETVEEGLPIGGYASQWFANFLLQPIDHYIVQNLYKERRGNRLNYVRHYLRYMDDMLLIGTDKRDLYKAVKAIKNKLQVEYNLTIKDCWEIKKIEDYPVDFVGYKFYRDHTEVRKNIFLRTKRLAAKIHKKQLKYGRIDLHDAQAMMSLLGWFSHADNKNFYKKYIDPFLRIEDLKEVISNETKNALWPNAAAVRD